MTTGSSRPDLVADPAPLVQALDIGISIDMLTLALTHRSYAYEHGGLPTNERLEFLGDSVLGVVVTEHLYREHPQRPEGELAKIRASVVNMYSLAEIARGLGEGGIGAHLLLGRGEELTGGRDKSSILADGMESLLGAIYIEHGFEPSRTVIMRLFADALARASTAGAGLDWKTSLQELTAERGLGVPTYRITSTGPDHLKEFTATVVVAESDCGVGVGRNKKEAEQKAAATAWESLSAADGSADNSGS